MGAEMEAVKGDLRHTRTLLSEAEETVKGDRDKEKEQKTLEESILGKVVVSTTDMLRARLQSIEEKHDAHIIQAGALIATNEGLIKSLYCENKILSTEIFKMNEKAERMIQTTLSKDLIVIKKGLRRVDGQWGLERFEVGQSFGGDLAQLQLEFSIKCAEIESLHSQKSIFSSHKRKLERNVGEIKIELGYCLVYLLQSQKNFRDLENRSVFNIAILKKTLDILHENKYRLKCSEILLFDKQHPIEELCARECIDKAKSCETIAERILLLETQLKKKERDNYFLRKRNIELGTLMAQELMVEEKDEAVTTLQSHGMLNRIDLDLRSIAFSKELREAEIGKSQIKELKIWNGDVICDRNDVEVNRCTEGQKLNDHPSPHIEFSNPCQHCNNKKTSING